MNSSQAILCRLPACCPPKKKLSSHRSHHERRLSVPQPPVAQEVIPKNLPENYTLYASMSHVNGDSSTHNMGQSLLRVVMDMHPIPRDKAGREAPARPRDEIRKYASTHICNFWLIFLLQSKSAFRQSLTQVNTDLPPVISSHTFPSDTRAASSAPQFVSIRAGGPTVPQA